MTKHARISPADIAYAKAAAEKAGLCLAAVEKRPDGSLRLEFSAPQFPDDWRVGSPLYERPS